MSVLSDEIHVVPIAGSKSLCATIAAAGTAARMSHGHALRPFAADAKACNVEKAFICLPCRR